MKKIRCYDCKNASYGILGSCTCKAHLVNEEYGYEEIDNPLELIECDDFELYIFDPPYCPYCKNKDFETIGVDYEEMKIAKFCCNSCKRGFIWYTTDRMVAKYLNDEAEADMAEARMEKDLCKIENTKYNGAEV